MNNNYIEFSIFQSVQEEDFGVDPEASKSVPSGHRVHHSDDGERLLR